MARKKKVIKSLPSQIELISAKTGRVREFSLSHAQSILALQLKQKLGSYTLYNTQLYQLDERTGTISIRIPDEDGQEPSFERESS